MKTLTNALRATIRLSLMAVVLAGVVVPASLIVSVVTGVPALGFLAGLYATAKCIEGLNL